MPGQWLDKTLVFRCDVTRRSENNGPSGQRNIGADQRHGRIRHIPAPDVEKPRHGVGRAHENSSGVLFLDCFLQAGDL